MFCKLVHRCKCLSVAAFIALISVPQTLLAANVPVFRSAVTYSTGGQNAIFPSSGGPPWIVAKDVNGDGKPDILVANWCANPKVCTDSSVAVLLNNGNGTFQPPVTYSTGGAHAFSVSVADLNADGKPDLIVAIGCANILSECSNGSIGVLLGNGNGTFQSVHNYPTGGSTTAIAVADLNHDGKLDVVASNCTLSSQTCPWGEGAVSVLLGNADGSFQPAVLYDSGALSAVYITVADINGDHTPDLLVVNQTVCNNCEGSIGVLLGRGDGTFQTVETYDAGLFYPGFLQVGDLNGDSKLDLVVTENTGGGGQLAVLLNMGNGNFQAPVVYGTGGMYATPVVAADLNGDGRLDLITTNGQGCSGQPAGDGCAGILLNTGDGSFLSAVTYNSQGAGAESLALADFDGDGHLDIAVTNQCSAFACDTKHGLATTTVLLGNGDGTIRQSLTYGVDFASDRVIVADLNGDGRPDLIVGNAPYKALGSVSVLLNGGVVNDTTPPGITLHATGKIVQATHGLILQVSISGAITDNLSGVNPGTATFAVSDSTGRVRRKGPLYLGLGGQYSRIIGVAPIPINPILQGSYKITIQAMDNAQNTRLKTVVLNVQ